MKIFEFIKPVGKYRTGQTVTEIDINEDSEKGRYLRAKIKEGDCLKEKVESKSMSGAPLNKMLNIENEENKNDKKGGNK